jgi:hypothetical protein
MRLQSDMRWQQQLWQLLKQAIATAAGTNNTDNTTPSTADCMPMLQLADALQQSCYTQCNRPFNASNCNICAEPLDCTTCSPTC